jgi:hypothetical protein
VPTIEHYKLNLERKEKKLKLAVRANDATHAQAQALDIARSLHIDKFELTYEQQQDSPLGQLFTKLAFSDFQHTECYPWQGSYVNNNPVIYTLGRRYYIRPLILDYMDMNRDNFVKMSCACVKCVNPYHNAYKAKQASKLTGGDIKLVVAYRSQGISVSQIAEVLNVHRSTIYRNLSNECLRSRPESHSGS